MMMRAEFARRLRAREPLVGTFVKSRDPATIEILGLAGFDFAILDAEHGAFDRSDLALMALASRAAQLPLVVRVPSADGGWIGTALDAGSAGIMVPQVRDSAMARDLVHTTRYGLDGRGFSPSVPGADYGTRGVAGHLDRAADETVLICQIETPRAVEQAADIAGVDGVDALLIGPVDLAVSMGLTDAGASSVRALGRQTIAASVSAGRAGGLFMPHVTERANWASIGASLFVLGSDQALLANAAKEAIAGFKK